VSKRKDLVCFENKDSGHILIKCLGQPRRESFFKDARHIYTNQLGILRSPTKIRSFGL